MMDRTIAVAPVRKSLRVNAPQARAFEVFTAGIDRWWPKGHGIGSAPLVKSVIEPFKGGRWFTTHEDGTEATVGHVLAWEPPSRFLFSWEINLTGSPTERLARKWKSGSRQMARRHLSNSNIANLKCLGRKAARRCARMWMAAGRASSSCSAKPQKRESRC